MNAPAASAAATRPRSRFFPEMGISCESIHSLSEKVAKRVVPERSTSTPKRESSQARACGMRCFIASQLAWAAFREGFLWSTSANTNSKDKDSPSAETLVEDWTALNPGIRAPIIKFNASNLVFITLPLSGNSGQLRTQAAKMAEPCAKEVRSSSLEETLRA